MSRAQHSVNAFERPSSKSHPVPGGFKGSIAGGRKSACARHDLPLSPLSRPAEVALPVEVGHQTVVDALWHPLAKLAREVGEVEVRTGCTFQAHLPRNWSLKKYMGHFLKFSTPRNLIFSTGFYGMCLWTGAAPSAFPELSMDECKGFSDIQLTIAGRPLFNLEVNSHTSRSVSSGRTTTSDIIGHEGVFGTCSHYAGALKYPTWEAPPKNFGTRSKKLWDPVKFQNGRRRTATSPVVRGTPTYV
ncbi:hypothetical protein PAPYR_10995 [Paratrimastix pyriformis]|uniref:Uncharacterized protein n=1 Tax=Paratrimastix pyriformis TaxID=342808 RepID=A0ABQ8U4R1_9EUKA|nr:hypothetical protein PAPYR_10995 [Paratrimastix pyriformis]